MRLSMIVAVALDGAIGYRNDLLWHLPADLRRFKQTTTGHVVLMGGNTFRSLPRGPLPNRRNVVISRTLEEGDGYEVCRSVEEAFALLGSCEDEIFVIGGAKIFEQLLPFTDRLYFTRVEATFPHADTFFPALDWSYWHLQFRERFPQDDANSFVTELQIWTRKDNPKSI